MARHIALVIPIMQLLPYNAPNTTKRFTLGKYSGDNPSAQNKKYNGKSLWRCMGWMSMTPKHAGITPHYADNYYRSRWREIL